MTDFGTKLFIQERDKTNFHHLVTGRVITLLLPTCPSIKGNHISDGFILKKKLCIRGCQVSQIWATVRIRGTSLRVFGGCVQVLESDPGSILPVRSGNPPSSLQSTLLPSQCVCVRVCARPSVRPRLCMCTCTGSCSLMTQGLMTD